MVLEGTVSKDKWQQLKIIGWKKSDEYRRGGLRIILRNGLFQRTAKNDMSDVKVIIGVLSLLTMS